MPGEDLHLSDLTHSRTHWPGPPRPEPSLNDKLRQGKAQTVEVNESHQERNPSPGAGVPQVDCIAEPRAADNAKMSLR